MGRQIIGKGPVQRIQAIIGKFERTVQELESAIDEATAEVNASRERVDVRRKELDEFEYKETQRRREYLEAATRAETLVDGIAKLMGGNVEES